MRLPEGGSISSMASLVVGVTGAADGRIFPMRSRDTSADADEIQLAAYASMEPAERLRIGLGLTALSRRLLEEGIRRRHPEYREEELRSAFLRAWLGGALFRAAYPDRPELES